MSALTPDKLRAALLRDVATSAFSCFEPAAVALVDADPSSAVVEDGEGPAERFLADEPALSDSAALADGQMRPGFDSRNPLLQIVQPLGHFDDPLPDRKLFQACEDVLHVD